MKILVVDDDPEILAMCAKALRAEGHSVTTCEAGNAALAAALGGSFDLALCDLNLPDIHGLEIVRAIKMHSPGLPVIVISALDPREWRARSVEAGADHFLQKPIRLETLRHEVRMAEASRLALLVALYVLEEGDGARMRLVQTFEQAGIPVIVATVPGDIVEGEKPDVVILDAGAPGTPGVIRWARASGVHCFVLVDKGRHLDDKLMRLGAALIVEKPADPDALVLQARFLAAR